MTFVILTSHPGWDKEGGRPGKSVFIPGPVGQKKQADEASAESCLELAQQAVATIPNTVLCTFTWSYIFMK